MKKRLCVFALLLAFLLPACQAEEPPASSEPLESSVSTPSSESSESSVPAESPDEEEPDWEAFPQEPDPEIDSASCAIPDTLPEETSSSAPAEASAASEPVATSEESPSQMLDVAPYDPGPLAPSEPMLNTNREPGSSAQPDPNAQPDPARCITIQIVDEQGNPVPYLTGGLEKRVGEGDNGSVVHTGLASAAGLEHSGETGVLYYWVDADGKNSFAGTCTVSLTHYYDWLTSEKFEVNMPEKAPATVTITWKGALPPSEKPPQTTGVRILLVDESGNPVEGVTMLGTSYPKEHKGPVPAIAGPFIGPTGKDGVIRWEMASGSWEAGTYPLSFFREGVEGASMNCDLKHPGGDNLIDIVVEFKY